MPKPEGYRVTTNSTAGPATLNRPPGCGRLDLSAFVRSVGAFRHVLRRWPNHGFALDHLHRDWNSRHCHSWAADIRAEGDIAFLRQIDPLEQCPSSSSRCRERDIGDSTPPSPLLERGGAGQFVLRFWMDRGGHRPLDLGSTRRVPDIFPRHIQLLRALRGRRCLARHWPTLRWCSEWSCSTSGSTSSKGPRVGRRAPALTLVPVEPPAAALR